MIAVEELERLDLILLTREQAAKKCGVSLNTIDKWIAEPGFPVIREGTHFVRIHAARLDEWLAERAERMNPWRPYRPVPQKRRPRKRKQP